MIFFQSRPLPLKGSGLGMKFVNHEGSGFGMKFVTRVGCKVFLKPSQNLPLQGKIVDIIVQPESTTENLENLVNPGNPGNRGRVKVTFKNSGMTHVRLNGSFKIEDEAGQLIAKGELQPPMAQVLAGDSRVVWAELAEPANWARHRRSQPLCSGATRALLRAEGDEFQSWIDPSEKSLQYPSRSGFMDKRRS